MELFQICDVQTSQYLSSTCIIYNKNSAVQKKSYRDECSIFDPRKEKDSRNK
jgi:hypothetical protein